MIAFKANWGVQMLLCSKKAIKLALFTWSEIRLPIFLSKLYQTFLKWPQSICYHQNDIDASILMMTFLKIAHQIFLAKMYQTSMNKSEMYFSQKIVYFSLSPFWEQFWYVSRLSVKLNCSSHQGELFHIKYIWSTNTLLVSRKS